MVYLVKIKINIYGLYQQKPLNYIENNKPFWYNLHRINEVQLWITK